MSPILLRPIIILLGVSFLPDLVAQTVPIPPPILPPAKPGVPLKKAPESDSKAPASNPSSANTDAPKTAESNVETEKKEGDAEAKPDEEKKEPVFELPLEPLEKMDSVRSYFSPQNDSLGFRWDIRGAGGIYRGQNSLFNGALNLEVNGASFSGAEAFHNVEKHRVRVKGVVTDVQVVRDVLIDVERGAASFLDVFSNPGEKEVELTIRYTSRFGESMRDGYFTDSGKRFTSNFEAKDCGVLFFSSPSRGSRPSVMFLLADPKAKNRPSAVNARTSGLTAEWKLTLKPGESKALLQVVIQRNLLSADSMVSEMRSIFRRRHLVNPVLAAEMMPLIENFHIEPPDPNGGDADRLIAVNQLCDALDVDREDTDMLWMGKESMLRGKIQGEALKLATPEGEMTIALADVAVLRGGGGRGLQHKVFLRDGTVFVADVTSAPMKLESPEGWKLDVAIDQLEYLVFHLDKSDGKFPEKGTDYILLHSGEIAAVDAGDIVLKIISPWGDVNLPAKQIQVMRYLKDPTPRYRLQLLDGSEFSAFVVNGDMELKAGRPAALKRRAGEIAAWWKLDLVPDLFENPEERDNAEGLEGKFSLLKGSNLLYGTLANESLHLVAGTTTTPLNPKEMRSITRLEESVDEPLAVFSIELEGGDSVTGYFKERFVDFRTGSGRIWTLPLDQLLAVKNEEPKVEEGTETKKVESDDKNGGRETEIGGPAPAVKNSRISPSAPQASPTLLP